MWFGDNKNAVEYFDRVEIRNYNKHFIEFIRFYKESNVCPNGTRVKNRYPSMFLELNMQQNYHILF